MNIKQFIEELLVNKAFEIEEFKVYIKDYKIEDKYSYTEWKNAYSTWEAQREEHTGNTEKIPKILLSDD